MQLVHKVIKVFKVFKAFKANRVSQDHKVIKAYKVYKAFKVIKEDPATKDYGPKPKPTKMVISYNGTHTCGRSYAYPDKPAGKACQTVSPPPTLFNSKDHKAFKVHKVLLVYKAFKVSRVSQVHKVKKEIKVMLESLAHKVIQVYKEQVYGKVYGKNQNNMLKEIMSNGTIYHTFSYAHPAPHAFKDNPAWTTIGSFL